MSLGIPEPLSLIFTTAVLFSLYNNLTFAHHYDFVRMLNRRKAMRKGQIIERGTHETLFKLGGDYRKLVELQGLS